MAKEVNDTEQFRAAMIKLGLAGFFVLFFVVPLVFNCWVTVPAGARGVLLDFGKPVATLNEGFSFKNPITQSVVIMNIQTLKQEATAAAASKDLQDVSATVALNYHLNADRSLELYQTIGNNGAIADTLISPAVQESVKASTAQFTAEQLITERQSVKARIEDGLRSRLGERGVFVETLSITNFNFSESFTRAIEEKQVAQQNALKAENDLTRIRTEAEQVRAQAQGQADATLAKAKAEAQSLQIQGEALRKNQEITQLRWIEKWNGVLPTFVSGENMPFIIDLRNTTG